MSRPPHQLWVFDPVGGLGPDQLEGWLRQCHQPSPVDQLLADPHRSIVVLTAPGCGMSTSLSLLPRAGLMTIDYPATRWPGGRDAFTRAEDHFGQWMGLIAQRLRDWLGDEAERFQQLDLQSHEFLAWIIRKYQSPRQGSLWLSRLRDYLSPGDWESVKATVEGGELDESYTGTGNGLTGQIDECLEIARRLGYRGIFAAIEVSWGEWLRRGPDQRAALAARVRELLSSLTLLQHRGFGMKIGLPAALGLTIGEIEQLVRGRATVTSYEWDEPAILAIARRMVDAAGAAALSAEPWCEPAIWGQVAADLRAIWGGLGPAAAAAFARALVELGAEVVAPTPEAISRLRRRLYERHAPIQLDPDLGRRTVWRGMQPISLEEAPFGCFELLWNERGRNVDTAVLKRRMGSQANLDKNISRIRQRIEPFFDKGDYLYLQRQISRGIWLDHYADPAGPALVQPPTA